MKLDIFNDVDHPGQSTCVFFLILLVLELYHEKKKKRTKINYKEKDVPSSVSKFGGMNDDFRFTVSWFI